MERLLLFALIIMATLGSCKKDDAEPDPVAPSGAITTEVMAGFQDSSYTHIIFGLPFQVNVDWDAQLLYGSGIDSLDLDTNGVFDLVIQLELLNYDSIHLLQGALPSPFPSCRLFGKEGLRIAARDQTYPIGQGQLATTRSADTLGLNRRIDQITKWDDGSGAGLAMWRENPPSAFSSPNGAWYNVNSFYYLGFNLPGGVYGWIEVNALDRNNPRITRYAYKQ